MEVGTVGLGATWVHKVWNWIAQHSKNKKEYRKDLLREVNGVLSQDPEVLAKLYIEPDFQPFNPANMSTDEPDDVDEHFRIRAYEWLDSFLIKPRRRDGRHVAFILSDAGMGKSSLLSMLKMTSTQGSWPGIQFRLFKLGKSSLDDIKNCEHPLETVLLLDSLDEDPEAFERIENAQWP